MASQLCYLALGSNVGDRLRHLSHAVRRLSHLDGVTFCRTSCLYSTAPQYVTDQPSFLNAVAEVELTSSRASDLVGLLRELKVIETDLGRTEGLRRGPRVIDIDIVALSEGRVSVTEGPLALEVPHAHLHERDFVLVPLADLCPDWRHPSLEGRPTVREMLQRLKAGLLKDLPPGASVETWPFQVLPAAGGLTGRPDGHLWRRGERTLIMGILNATPDSFSDGGDHLLVADALAAAEAMVAAGADILDIGGESTRPGAVEVPEAEEVARVVPVIRGIRERGLNVTISIDTRKAAVARAAVAAGADWINDVSAGEHDAGMLPSAAELGAPVVLMHMRGTPETMASLASYGDVVAEVAEHLAARRRAAEVAGVPTWNIIVDPGIGFAKAHEHNLMLLRHCDALAKQLHPSPILIGASRKRFLGTILGEPEPKKRTFGNAACTAAAVVGGADVVRVHEVKEMAQTARVCDEIYRSGA